MNSPIILDDVDTSYLDKHLIDPLTGRIKLLPASLYEEIPWSHLRVWCHKTARYNIPTKELVEFLGHEIRGRTAIEICSGNGDLGFHLGIRETDAHHQQDHPLAKLLLTAYKQPATKPKGEKIEALKAVKKYGPQVVVAAWATQFGHTPGVSSSLGVKELKLIPMVESYIHVGNETIHGAKLALRLPSFKGKTWAKWLVSRAARPELNVIYKWDNMP